MLPYVSQDFPYPFAEPPDTALPQLQGSCETTSLQQQIAANMIVWSFFALSIISHKQFLI